MSGLAFWVCLAWKPNIQLEAFELTLPLRIVFSNNNESRMLMVSPAFKWL